jgi:hypothetical protein
MDVNQRNTSNVLYWTHVWLLISGSSHMLSVLFVKFFPENFFADSFFKNNSCLQEIFSTTIDALAGRIVYPHKINFETNKFFFFAKPFWVLDINNVDNISLKFEVIWKLRLLPLHISCPIVTDLATEAELNWKFS